VIVACSTLCFARHPFERALQIIADLGFSKVDVALHEAGPYLRPSQVVEDIFTTSQQLRLGPGLNPCAFSVVLEAADPEQYRAQLQGICRLARVSSVPLISVSAAPAGSELAAEIQRLTELSQLAAAEGIILTVTTTMGTVTEEARAAVELCQRVPGLGLTLDPSHFVAGPQQGQNWEGVYPYVRHVRLRDTGTGPDQFQLRIGEGVIEYGRIISQLARYSYDRALVVDIHDLPEPSFPMEPEVRKLKYLLESLV
jgi:sugar phosphate isomerase/epimerase